MVSTLPKPRGRDNRRRWQTWACSACALLLWAGSLWRPPAAGALGQDSSVAILSVRHGPAPAGPRREVTRRLAWEIRKRTSIETRLEPTEVRLGDKAMFDAPLLYWSGEAAFPELDAEERRALRRVVQYGGFVIIDNAAPDSSGFDQSVRRTLAKTFPRQRLRPLDTRHTIFRSFYLLDRPVGRVFGPAHLEGIVLGGRAALVYSRHDLGGAWARDDLGNAEYPVTPGGSAQRENAIRLGVNLVMYALCLDYKDDQVHAPFILRRRGGGR